MCLALYGMFLYGILFLFQTQETPLHYCARAGNADVLLEIVKHIGPSHTQLAVNKQAKVPRVHNTFIQSSNNIIIIE
jgi:hypothetical protein